MFEALKFFGAGTESLGGSTIWLRVTNVLCVLGALVGALSAYGHYRQWRVVHGKAGAGAEGRATGGNTGPDKLPGNPFAFFAMLALAMAIVATCIGVGLRWIEVNHFPSQTMREVLVMFSSSLLLSMFVLHFALRLGRLGRGWAIADDVMLMVVFLGVFFVNYYSGTLSSAQKDLPPALQSYWFPPHLSALIFSYATMGIAGVVAMIYFCVRFWMGAFRGGRSIGSQFVVLAVLLLIPFAQVVTIPVWLLVGLVFLVLKSQGKLPETGDLGKFEKTMDEVSYRAFSVGIPFLTAGLFMGAFWAQEAWANYWGWDSKENSALITWLVYVAYIHLRMLGGYRGEKAMAVLLGGALSVFLTFQIFGYLPDSQKSLHRYTDDGVVPREGMQGATAPAVVDEARLEQESR